MQIPGSEIVVGRVLSEDDDRMVIELAKNDESPFTLAQALDPEAEPDRFFTLLFVSRSDEDNSINIGKPW